MEKIVRLEIHGGELHLVVHNQFVCDLAAFRNTDGPIGPLADNAVENLTRILSEQKS